MIEGYSRVTLKNTRKPAKRPIKPAKEPAKPSGNPHNPQITRETLEFRGYPSLIFATPINCDRDSSLSRSLYEVSSLSQSINQVKDHFKSSWIEDFIGWLSFRQETPRFLSWRKRVVGSALTLQCNKYIFLPRYLVFEYQFYKLNHKYIPT
jgi:hypothetical protein